MQFEDKDHYLLVFLLPLSVLLYVLTPFIGAVRLLQVALSAIVSLLFYFMLWVYWPDMFPLWSTTMAVLVLVVMVVMVGLVFVWAWAAAIVALSLVAVPAINHNATWIAAMFGAPQWAGYIFMTVGIGLCALLVWMASIFPLVRTLVKAGFSSFFFMVMLRTVHLEEPPDLRRTDLACGDGDTGRCPYALDSWPFLILWLALFGVLCWVMHRMRRARKRRERDAKEAERQRRLAHYRNLVQEETHIAEQPPPVTDGSSHTFAYSSIVS